MSILLLMFYLYFFQGFKVFLVLTFKDYQKTILKLQPDESQYFTTIVGIPWIFKIVFGLIADNFSLFGSYRNSYLRVTALLQFLSLFILSFESVHEKHTVLAIAFSLQLFTAFQDVICDAIMVKVCKVDPINGAPDL